MGGVELSSSVRGACSSVTGILGTEKVRVGSGARSSGFVDVGAESRDDSILTIGLARLLVVSVGSTGVDSALSTVGTRESLVFPESTRIAGGTDARLKSNGGVIRGVAARVRLDASWDKISD